MSDIRKAAEVLGLPSQEDIVAKATLLSSAAAKLSILLCAYDENASISSFDERRSAQPDVPISDLLSPKESSLLPGAYEVVLDIFKAATHQGGLGG